MDNRRGNDDQTPERRRPGVVVVVSDGEQRQNQRPEG